MEVKQKRTISSRAKKFAFAVINLVPRIFEDRRSGLIQYGEDNTLPETINKAISSSIVATNSVSKYKTFIEGKGFKAKGLNGKMANEKQTFHEIHQLITSSLAKYKGFYLNVQYGADGLPEKIYSIPFSRIRVNTKGEFVYKKVWKGTDMKDAIIYPAFNPLATPEDNLKMVMGQVAKNEKQIGTIVAAFFKDEDCDSYPKQEFVSGFDDIESDAALQMLEKRNIKRGFKTNVIIKTVGEIDDTTEDEFGKTDYDYWSENLSNFSDEEDAPSILHLYAKTGEAMPEVDIFDLAQILDGVDKARDRVGRKVCQAFDVPPIIVGFQQPEGWGNSQALVNSMKLFMLNITKYQELEKNTLSKIFLGIDFTIDQLSLIEYIPDKLIDSLTNDEKRQLAGKEPLPVEDTTGGVSLAEKLGVGSTTSLFDVIRDPIMTSVQKYNSLIEVFNLAPDKASKLIYGTDIPPTTTENPPA